MAIRDGYESQQLHPRRRTTGLQRIDTARPNLIRPQPVRGLSSVPTPSSTRSTATLERPGFSSTGLQGDRIAAQRSPAPRQPLVEGRTDLTNWWSRRNEPMPDPRHPRNNEGLQSTQAGWTELGRQYGSPWRSAGMGLWSSTRPRYYGPPDLREPRVPGAGAGGGVDRLDELAGKYNTLMGMSRRTPPPPVAAEPVRTDIPMGAEGAEHGGEGAGDRRLVGGAGPAADSSSEYGTSKQGLAAGAPTQPSGGQGDQRFGSGGSGTKTPEEELIDLVVRNKENVGVNGEYPARDVLKQIMADLMEDFQDDWGGATFTAQDLLDYVRETGISPGEVDAEGFYFWKNWRDNQKAKDEANTNNQQKIDAAKAREEQFWNELNGLSVPEIDPRVLEEQIQAQRRQRAIMDSRNLMAQAQSAARMGLAPEASLATQADYTQQSSSDQAMQEAQQRMQVELTNLAQKTLHYQTLARSLFQRAANEESEQVRNEAYMEARKNAALGQAYQERLMQMQYEMQNRFHWTDVLGAVTGGIGALGSMAVGLGPAGLGLWGASQAATGLASPGFGYGYGRAADPTGLSGAINYPRAWG